MLNSWRYLSLAACGTAQSLAPVLGELLASEAVEEELELRETETVGIRDQRRNGDATGERAFHSNCLLAAQEDAADFQTITAAAAAAALISRVCFHGKQCLRKNSKRRMGRGCGVYPRKMLHFSLPQRASEAGDARALL